MSRITVLVIDGQGGRIGKQLIEGIRAYAPDADVVAVGTNSVATGTMMKAGADRCATGENAVVVNCRSADVIAGPLGIAIADSMLGEISPAMAVAVGQSRARRLLIPISLCRSTVVGVSGRTIRELISMAVEEIRKICAGEAEA